MDAYETRLQKAQWLGGQQPSDEDARVCAEMKASPPTIAHPHLFAWYSLCSKFQECITSTWKPAAAPQQKGKGKGGKQQKAEPKKEAPKPKPAPKEEEDEMDDLFAEDEDDSEARDHAAMLRGKAFEAKKKAAAEAAGKAPMIAKSLVIWEVKPVDDETDLQVLGKRIIDEIQQDGLYWKTEFKTQPIAYGIEKIIIGATIEDAKVSTDDVQERIEAMEDMVQSVDIQSFNKL